MKKSRLKSGSLNRSYLIIFVLIFINLGVATQLFSKADTGTNKVNFLVFCGNDVQADCNAGIYAGVSKNSSKGVISRPSIHSLAHEIQSYYNDRLGQTFSIGKVYTLVGTHKACYYFTSNTGCTTSPYPSSFICVGASADPSCDGNYYRAYSNIQSELKPGNNDIDVVLLGGAVNANGAITSMVKSHCGAAAVPSDLGIVDIYSPDGCTGGSDLVSAHELGHAFGLNHDNVSNGGSCSATSSLRDGKLMDCFYPCNSGALSGCGISNNNLVNDSAFLKNSVFFTPPPAPAPPPPTTTPKPVLTSFTATPVSFSYAGTVSLKAVATNATTYRFTVSPAVGGLPTTNSTGTLSVTLPTNLTTTPQIYSFSVTPSGDGGQGSPQSVTVTVNPAPVTSSAASPAAAMIPANYNQNVFWRGTDGNLWESWFYGAWFGPVNHGGGPLGSPPTAGDDNFGNHYVYWKGTDGNLWQGFYAAANGTWYIPYNLGAGPLNSQPAVGVTPTTTAQSVFWRGTDGNLWEKWYDSKAWHVPINHFGGPLGSAPTAANDNAGSHYVFWTGTDSNLWEAFYSGPANAWYLPLPLGAGPLNSQPSVAVNPVNSNQYVFWKGTDDNIWEKWHDSTGWHGPQTLGMGPINSAPTAIADNKGNLNVYWRSTTNLLWEAWSSNNSTWNGPVQVGSGIGPLN